MNRLRQKNYRSAHDKHLSLGRKQEDQSKVNYDNEFLQRKAMQTHNLISIATHWRISISLFFAHELILIDARASCEMVAIRLEGCGCAIFSDWNSKLWLLFSSKWMQSIDWAPISIERKPNECIRRQEKDKSPEKCWKLSFTALNGIRINRSTRIFCLSRISQNLRSISIS